MAKDVLLATGAFTNFNSLVSQPLQLKLIPHTVVLFEVSKDDLKIYEKMPSLIYNGKNEEASIYILPPIAYPWESKDLQIRRKTNIIVTY